MDLADVLPKGKLIEICGDQSGGKTTLALKLINKCQQDGGVAVYIDVDYKVNPGYFAKIINIDETYVHQCKDVEALYEHLTSLLSTRMVDIIVIDSIGSLSGKKGISNEVKSFIMKLSALVFKYDCAGVIINQYRFKDGVEVPMYNELMSLYSSLRLTVTETEDQETLHIQVKKSKLKVEVTDFQLSV
jgi:recombination protein RecA